MSEAVVTSCNPLPNMQKSSSYIMPELGCSVINA
jgi:hypothetical protein